MGDLVPVEEHPLRCPSRAGVLFECCLLLEEDPPDLIQSFLRAMGNYFDDTTQRSCWMVLTQKVVYPKGKHGDQGPRDYSQNHLAATATIPKIFGAVKHFCTKNADGKLSYKYKDIQSKYVGNLDKLKLFR